MKKIVGFVMILLLASSCTCMLAQIPPQYIEVGENCEALLPDYTTPEYVVVTDNCQIKSVTQDPVAGTILNASNPQVTVTITATDAFDNFTQVSFPVKAIDKQPPVITPTGEFLTDNWVKINSLYDQADQLVAEQEAYFDTNFDWEASGIPVELRPINQYDTKTLLTWSYTLNDKRERLFTFISNNDTFQIR